MSEMQITDESAAPKVLVTGGTSGIGLEIAINLLKKGYEVAVVGQDPVRGAEAQRKLTATLGKSKVYTIDLADKNSAKIIEQQFARDFGSIDILVNNAGYATYETFEETAEEEIERLLAVNLLAHMKVTRAFLPAMIRKGSGQIVNISSVAGDIVITPNAVYMASKQAINAWSRALSYELDRFGIKVKVFCPGRVQTKFFDHPTFKKRILRPEMRQAMSAEWCADQIVRRMLGSNAFLFHIPWRFRFIAWCYAAIPLAEWLLFRPLMIARVNTLYKQHEAEMRLQKQSKKVLNEERRDLPTLPQ